MIFGCCNGVISQFGIKKVLSHLMLFVHLYFCPVLSRITYVQSTPGVSSTLVPTTTVPSTGQQALSVAGSAYVPSALATLGFTAIAPPGQALVQPLITGRQPAASISDSCFIRVSY